MDGEREPGRDEEDKAFDEMKGLASFAETIVHRHGIMGHLSDDGNYIKGYSSILTSWYHHR